MLKKKIKEYFFGRESYGDQDWTLSFDGLIPAYLIKRIHRAGQSGIRQWWTKLLGKISDDERPESQPVKAATMKGNIFIIFILWAIFVTVAMISFIVEVYKLPTKYMKSCVKVRHRSTFGI